MATQLTENQRLWLHAMYASEYTWFMHHVNYLRTAAEGSTSVAKRKALLREADEREGYANHLARLRDADEPQESAAPQEDGTATQTPEGRETSGSPS